MTWDIVRFEWRYHTRQISFLGACALFLLGGFVLSATGFGPDNLHINSPYVVMESVGLLSLLSVFVLAVFSANAIVRDREYRMEEIVFSTAVEKSQFLGGRFAGSFLAAFTAFATCAIGMIAGLYAVAHDASEVAPLRVVSYVWALLVLALPNLLFAAVLLFAIAVLTRSLLASSVGAVLIYVLYFVVAAWTNSPLMAGSVPGGANSWIVSLFDPFGISAFFEQTRYWTAAERNARLTSLTGVFLGNRLLWIAIAGAGWAAVHKLFAFRVVPAARRRASRRDAGAPAIPYATVEQTPSPLAAWWSSARIDLRSYVRNLPFLALTILWAALALSEISSDLGSGEYGSSSYATTGLVLAAMQQALQLIALIVLTWFSTEMVWRERTLRMNGILDATPAPGASFVLAKWAALVALVVILAVAGIGVGLLYQLTHGVTTIEWTEIAAFLWFNVAPLAVFAMLAVLVHTVLPHKYLGMMAVLLLAVFMRQATLTGSVHHLLAFGSAPQETAAFNWYMLHWTLLGALLLTIAAARWRRAPLRSVRTPLIALAVAAIASGAFIAYNTLVLNDWESPASRRAWRAGYERTYGRFAAMPQPKIAAIEATVDLAPQSRSYRAHGVATLRNDSAATIDRILVGVSPDAQRTALSIPGAAIGQIDKRFGHTWFQLALPPGATARLSFDVAFAARGFSDQAPDTSVIPNGSLVASSRIFPMIGYRQRYELADPADRRREGLPAKSIDPDESEAIDWVTSDITVTTAAGETAVTSGRRVGASRFVSDGLIPNAVTIASARYRVARSSWGNVPIEIYYEHDQNVARMLETAKLALDTFSHAFGPYPHKQLKIVEAAPPDFSGIARPDTVFLGEKRGFLIDPRRAELDLVARRLSHEIAHQWWGGQLTPADQPGATVLTESLTKYAELLLLERMQGRAALRRSLGYELDLYLAGRADQTGAEPPLSRAGRESYLYYRKGSLAMHAIHELLGEEKLNQALRSLIAEQGGPGKRPTVSQLLDHLLAVATPAQWARIDEWMNRVVLDDAAIESAYARPLGDGRFEVTVKTKGDDVEIGLYDEKDEELYLGKQATVIVNRQPVTAIADPYFLRIDRNRADNVKSVP